MTEKEPTLHSPLILKKANNVIFFHFMISILWKNGYLCQKI